MSQEQKVELECTACKRITHYTRKNKKTIKDRLELKKHCKFCKGHTGHKEAK